MKITSRGAGIPVESMSDLYQHYKGGVYRLICPAMLESDCEVYAVYESLEDGKIWTRPMSEFADKFKQLLPKKSIDSDISTVNINDFLGVRREDDRA